MKPAGARGWLIKRDALRDSEKAVHCQSTHQEVIMDWTLEVVVIPVSDIDRSTD
jgi:hypothetical protein